MHWLTRKKGPLLHLGNYLNVPSRKAAYRRSLIGRLEPIPTTGKPETHACNSVWTGSVVKGLGLTYDFPIQNLDTEECCAANEYDSIKSALAGEIKGLSSNPLLAGNCLSR